MTIATADQAYEDEFDHFRDKPIQLEETSKEPAKKPAEQKLGANDDYDMDAWKKANPNVEVVPGQHYPDTYKKPNHPTFSDESIYHGKDGTEGGHWDKNQDGTWNFTPGKTNLENHSPEELQDYFNRVEPGNKLNLPSQPEINTDHNVKSGAVASKDSNTVYVDPSIPKEFHPFLAVHENTEKQLMAGGMSYKEAHVQATLAEKQAVESSGQDWVKYTDTIDPYVAKTEKGDGKNPPPDPHVNIEDAIGHHADKASTLEKADIAIGDGKLGSFPRPLQDKAGHFPVGQVGKGDAPFSDFRPVDNEMYIQTEKEQYKHFRNIANFADKMLKEDKWDEFIKNAPKSWNIEDRTNFLEGYKWFLRQVVTHPVKLFKDWKSQSSTPEEQFKAMEEDYASRYGETSYKEFGLSDPQVVDKKEKN